MKIFLFGFALFGYGSISFLVNDPSVSRVVTVPYRLIILLLSFFVILYSIVKENKKLYNYQTQSVFKIKTLSQLILFFLFIFIFVYSIRLSFDLSNLDNFLIRPSNEYLLNWFGICLLPGLSFLFIHPKQSENYLYCSWFFLLITSLLALFINKQESIVFIQQGRLSGAAFNSILLSHYGVSLVLLSTFIFFSTSISSINLSVRWRAILSLKTIKKSMKSKIHLNIYLSFFCLLTIFLGCFVILLASSRGPILAAIFCVVLLIIGARKNHVKLSKLLTMVTIGFSGLVIASYMALQLGSSFLDRISGIFAQDSSLNSIDSIRSNFLQSSNTLIWDNFILGYGLELPGTGYPHNLVVEAFLSTGFLGGIIFTIVYFYSIGKAIFLIMNDWEQWGWLGLIYVQYAIGAMLSGALYSSSTFWYLLFAVISRKSLRSRYEIKQPLPNLAET
jgi:hypothetical protein